MNHNLVPEIRLDKNGVAVTRHVKTQGAVSSKALPGPALAVSDKKHQEALRHVGTVERIRATCSGSIEKFAQISEDKFFEYISDFSQETLDLIEAQTGSDNDKVHIAEFIDALDTCDGEELAIREYLTYGTSLADCEDYQETFRYIEGLRHYAPFRKVDDLSTLRGDEAVVAHVLLKTGLHFHCFDEDSFTEKSKGKYVVDPRSPGEKILPVMKSTQIAKLIIDNPKRAEHIYEYIKERDITSAKVLGEMIKDTHHAVSDGFL